MDSGELAQLQKLFSDSNTTSLGGDAVNSNSFNDKLLLNENVNNFGGNNFLMNGVKTQSNTIVIIYAALIFGLSYLNIKNPPRSDEIDNHTLVGKINLIVRSNRDSLSDQYKVVYFSWLLASLGFYYYIDNNVTPYKNAGISTSVGLLVAFSVLTILNMKKGMDAITSIGVATVLGAGALHYLAPYNIPENVDMAIGCLIFVILGLQLSYCSLEVCENPYKGLNKVKSSGSPQTLEEAHKQCYGKWDDYRKNGDNPMMDYGWCPSGENQGKCYHFSKNEGGMGKLCSLCPGATVPDGSGKICDNLPSPNKETQNPSPTKEPFGMQANPNNPMNQFGGNQINSLNQNNNQNGNQRQQNGSFGNNFAKF